MKTQTVRKSNPHMNPNGTGKHGPKQNAQKIKPNVYQPKPENRNKT